MKGIKEKNNKFNIIDIIIAIFTTIAMSLSLDLIEISQEGSNNMLAKINSIVSTDFIKFLVIFIAMFFMIRFRKKLENKHCIIKNLFAIVLSIFMIIGYCYTQMGTCTILFKNAIQAIKTCVIFAGYWMLFYNIVDIGLFYLVEKIEYKPCKNKVFNFIFEKHSFLIPLVIIIVCWSPYLVAFYPGCLMPDSSTQIEQFFGIEIDQNSVSNSVKLIDENVKITNHHPVFHTVLLGSCMKIGKWVGNDNVGILLCTLMQVICLSIALACIINFMKKLKTNNWIRAISLFMFALFPIFPMCAIKITKDIPFAAILILYVIELYKLIQNANKEKISVKRIILIVVLSMLLSLIRNNGIYTILLSLPFIFIIDKLNRKRLFILVISIFVLYKLVVSVLWPTLKISPSSSSEMFSIPFQQTARYVKQYPNDVTDKEKAKIEKVLNYKYLAKKYNPEKSDPVKKLYNKDSNKKDLINYLKVWLKMFTKHPAVYFDAYFNNYYGYIYPDTVVQDLGTGYIKKADPILLKTGQFKYGYKEDTLEFRKALKQITNLSYKLPVVSWLINIAITNWVLIGILVYLLSKKKFKDIIYILPGLSVMLVCFASPLNSCYRYSLPNIFMMPLTISIFINCIKTYSEKGAENNGTKE